MDEDNGKNPTPKVPFPLNLVMSGVNEPPKPPTIPPPLKNSSGGSFSPKSSSRNHEKASSSTERSLLDTVSFFIRIVAFILFWGFILDIFVFAVSSLMWAAGGDFFKYISLISLVLIPLLIIAMFFCAFLMVLFVIERNLRVIEKNTQAIDSLEKTARIIESNTRHKD